MKAYESLHQEETDTKPNTWGWAANLAEKVRRSKLARFMGSVLLSGYRPPEPEQIPRPTSDWRKDPHESRYVDDYYVPEGRVLQRPPTPMKEAPQVDRYKVEGTRFETPAELNARMLEFDASHPGVDAYTRYSYEVTGNVQPPIQRVTGNEQPPADMLANASAHQLPAQGAEHIKLNL